MVNNDIQLGFIFLLSQSLIASTPWQSEGFYYHVSGVSYRSTH